MDPDVVHDRGRRVDDAGEGQALAVRGGRGQSSPATDPHRRRGRLHGRSGHRRRSGNRDDIHADDASSSRPQSLRGNRQ